MPSTNPKALPVVEPGGVVSEDDDTISLTSTAPDVPPNSDDEYEVENILAERVSDGAMQYLVQWTGYPLHECTWEPVCNVNDILMDIWEARKKEEEQGLVEKFDVSIFDNARDEATRAREERHRRRNAKRKRLGLPLTEPFESRPSNRDAEPGSDGESASSDEAVEDGTFEVDVPAAPRKQRQTIFKTSAAATPAAAKSAIAHKASALPTGVSRRASIAKAIPKATGPSAAAKPAPLAAASMKKRPEASQIPHKMPALSKTVNKAPSKDPVRVAGAPNAPGKQLPGKPVAVRSKPPRPTLPPLKTGSAASSSSKTVLGNAFVDGKKPRTRKPLEAVVSDPTKEKTLFGKHRYLRLAEIRERDKADAAPELTGISPKLFPITKRPDGTQVSPTSPNTEDSSSASAKGPGGESAPSRENAPGLPAKPSITKKSSEQPPAATPVTTGASEASPSADLSGVLATQTTKKKRKAVRFVDDDSPVAQEPVEHDALMTVSRDDEPNKIPRLEGRDVEAPRGQSVAVVTGPSTEAPAKKISLAAYHSRSPTLSQSVAKKVIFGPRPDLVLEVTLSGVSRDTSQLWLSAFLDEEVLKFGHVCFAETFIAQFGAFRVGVLCSGVVLPTGNTSELEAAAAYLKIRASGLYLSRPTFNILLYPARCEEWNADLLGVEPGSPSGAALKYLVFSSSFNCGPFLRSKGTSEEESKGVASFISNREFLMHSFFGVNAQTYGRLLPEGGRRPGAKAHIYLAFPLSMQEAMKQITLWLRAHGPDCEIYTSAHSGGWHAFVEKMLSGPVPGCVIIHESATWTIRRFPKLLALLGGNAECKFWWWSQSTYSPPIFPSRSLEEGLRAPGCTRMVRLFRTGSVILVTPSFIVSEPRRAYELFHWFSRARHESRLRLVTAWNIRDYLEELAMEKMRQREEIWAAQSSATVVDRELAANLKGLSQNDCEYRFRTWLLISELLSFREVSDRWSVYDESNPIYYADEAIDANDEQSLVNWFGWWSNLRLDYFRNFHVAGSNAATKWKGSERARRIVSVPHYSRLTNPDPDAGWSRKDLEPEPGATSVPTGPAVSPQPAADESQAGLRVPDQPQRLETRKSKMLPDDSWRTIANFIERVLPSGPRKHEIRCFCYPIFWKDSNEAFRSSELNTKNQVISDWFKYTWPFGADHVKNYNTYVGFFYMPDDNWVPETARPGQKVPRRPWLVIYRPVNPYVRPFTKTEVIIWDPAANRKFPGPVAVAEADLSSAQRAVIQYIRDHGPEKNAGTELDRIWLGGYQQPKNTECDLDAALSFMEELTPSFFELVPAKASKMRGQGYKRVTMAGEGVAGPEKEENGRRLSTASTSRMDIDEGRPGSPGKAGPEQETVSDEETGTKMIFHPPRGTLPPHVTSKCRNHLYESARLARIRDPNAKTMEYEYRPTMEWYQEQRDEGRGYEHINVNTWEVVFNTFKIGSGTPGESPVNVTEGH